MSVLEVIKTYPPSPLSDSVFTNIPHPSSTSIHKSLDESLSGNLDDYVISKPETLANGPGLIIKAKSKKSHQERYHIAAKATATLEERLLKVEETLQTLKTEKEYTDSVFLRSQIYTRLLSILQDQLFKSLPYYLQKDLKKAGLKNLPQTFVIWWNAWNDCDPNNFPLPSSISQSHYTYDSGLFSFVHLLFDHRGRESQIGISVRKAWEKLDPQAEARDLIVYCWCVEKSGNVVRNAIAHPVATKTQAEQLLSRDLCRGLQYPCAMKYVSTSNDFTT